MKFILVFILLVTSSLSMANSCQGDLKVFSTLDPRDQSAWDVKAREYLPAKSKTSVLFVLPTILGESALEQNFANWMCQSGLAVYILNTVRPSPPETDVVDFVASDFILIRAKSAVSHVIDVLELTGEFNGNFVIVGMSLGAIQAAYVHAREPRLKASVIVAGAGNMPGIQAYSAQVSVAAERENRMRILGLSDPKIFEELLQKRLKEDPLDLASNIPPAASFIFIATKDTSVPTLYQLQLKDALTQPEVKTIADTHINVIKKVAAQHKKEIYLFLMERMNVSALFSD